ncbi:MAG: hypothetical protein AAFR73_12065 [Pseudomonadota bacterium]
MTDDTTNLILEHLRAIRKDMADFRDEQLSQAERMVALETHMSGILTSLTNVGSDVHTLKQQMRQVQNRLDLVDDLPTA